MKIISTSRDNKATIKKRESFEPLSAVENGTTLKLVGMTMHCVYHPQMCAIDLSLIAIHLYRSNNSFANYCFDSFAYQFFCECAFLWISGATSGTNGTWLFETGWQWQWYTKQLQTPLRRRNSCWKCLAQYCSSVL